MIALQNISELKSGPSLPRFMWRPGCMLYQRSTTFTNRVWRIACMFTLAKLLSFKSSEVLEASCVNAASLSPNVLGDYAGISVTAALLSLSFLTEPVWLLTKTGAQVWWMSNSSKNTWRASGGGCRGRIALFLQLTLNFGQHFSLCKLHKLSSNDFVDARHWEQRHQRFLFVIIEPQHFIQNFGSFLDASAIFAMDSAPFRRTRICLAVSNGLLFPIGRALPSGGMGN